MKKKISQKNSLIGWKLITWAKGRKKTLITMVAALLMYHFTDSEVASIVAGSVVEGSLAIIEYYLKQVENP